MKNKYLFPLLILAFHLLILIKLQFTAWPEMVSFPYLINHGFITYKDMIHAYPPLLVNVLSVVYKIFGYKLVVLEIFGWTTILFSDLLIFLILKKIVTNKNLPLYGLFVYVILQTILEGNMVWPDLFIIPFLLLAFIFLLNKKHFLVGLSIGLSLLTKQTGVLFLGVSGAYIFLVERRTKALVKYVLGILLILLSFIFSLISQNAFHDFVNWTVIYPSRYWTNFPGYVQLLPTLRENLVLLILFFPLAFLIFKSKKRIFADKKFLLIFSLLVTGIIGVYPRFSFFHFQPALAFLIILYVYLLKDFKNLYLFFIIPVFVLVVSFRSLQFGEPRFWTISDLELGQIIENETSSGKPVYLLGLDSNLYTFSNRSPNKPWLDNFGWYLEIPDVQRTVINGFEKDPPSTVFWVTPEAGNWYDIGTYQPKMITDWIQRNYVQKVQIGRGIWEWTRK